MSYALPLYSSLPILALFSCRTYMLLNWPWQSEVAAGFHIHTCLQVVSHEGFPAGGISPFLNTSNRRCKLKETSQILQINESVSQEIWNSNLTAKYIPHFVHINLLICKYCIICWFGGTAFYIDVLTGLFGCSFKSSLNLRFLILKIIICLALLEMDVQCISKGRILLYLA